MRKIINLERFIKNKTLREWTEALIFALIVATIFRTWLYSPFRVPTGSMIPVIQRGDQLFAEMFAYGFVIPFTDKKIFSSPVEKGDIIIFPSPQNPPECASFFYATQDTVVALIMGFINPNYSPTCIDFIKRAVAIGGDTLDITGEKTLVNGKEENGYVPHFSKNNAPLGTLVRLKIPEGEVFAMGDNRRNSHDSRFWGTVKEDQIRAKGKMIYLSIDPDKSLFTGIRFNRMFQTLK